MVEHRRRDAPTRSGRRQHRVGRHEHVGEEHLVEVHRTVELSDRADLDARRVEIDDEHRQTVVLGRRWDRCGPAGCRSRRGGRASSTPSGRDDPAARHRVRPGRNAGEVGAGTGFGEQLAPDLSSGEDARHVPTALGVGAELQQRRQAVAEGDRRAARSSAGSGRPPPATPSRSGGRQAVAADGRRHAEPGQTGGVERALEAERPIECAVATGIVVG